MAMHAATWVLVVLPSTTLIGRFSTFWVRKEVKLNYLNEGDISFHVWTDLKDPHRQQVTFLTQKITYLGDTHTRIWYVLRLEAGQYSNRLIGGRSESWHINRFRGWQFRTFNVGGSIMPLLVRNE